MLREQLLQRFALLEIVDDGEDLALVGSEFYTSSAQVAVLCLESVTYKRAVVAVANAIFRSLGIAARNLKKCLALFIFLDVK